MPGKRVLFFFTCLVAMATCFPMPAVSGSRSLTVTADQQLGLGDMFFSKGEYDRAVTAYETFLYFFPDDDKANYARFRIAMSYFKKEDFQGALEKFENIYRDEACGKFRIDAGFMAARCYVALGMRERAVTILEMLADLSHDNSVRDRAFYETGWSCLWTRGSLDDKMLAMAQENFAKISEKSKERLNVGGILNEIEIARHGDDGLLSSMKSPRLAGALGVVPGAGYLYCRRPGDALAAFLFNSMMMLAAYEAFDNGNGALGAVISVVELGFYGGSIYGSVGAAHKYNKRQTAFFLDRLRTSARAGIMPAGRGTGLQFFLQKPF